MNARDISNKFARDISNKLVIFGVSLTFILSFGFQDVNAQGRQEYPRIDEEEWIEVNPGERYNCPECKMIFQGTEFTVWEHPDGNRVVVASAITDSSILLDEGFVYNYCFRGVQHAIPGQCDSPEYEQYKIE
jgi:hypothetical protein